MLALVAPLRSGSDLDADFDLPLRLLLLLLLRVLNRILLLLLALVVTLFTYWPLPPPRPQPRPCLGCQHHVGAAGGESLAACEVAASCNLEASEIAARVGRLALQLPRLS